MYTARRHKLGYFTQSTQINQFINEYQKQVLQVLPKTIKSLKLRFIIQFNREIHYI